MATSAFHPPLRDQAAEAGSRGEVGVEVERIAIARDLGVELDRALRDGLLLAGPLADPQAQRTDHLPNPAIRIHVSHASASQHAGPAAGRQLPIERMATRPGLDLDDVGRPA
jgi:hypothetical protein